MTEHPPLEIALSESNGVHLLQVRGRLTIGDASKQLIQTFEQVVHNGARKMVVNLQAVPQIDSSGLSSLVRMALQLAKEQGALHLVCGAGRVRDALKVTRLLEVIPTFDSDSTAMAKFSLGASP